MSKYYFMGLVFCLLLTVSAPAYFEDFENPGSVKMTLNDGQTVTSGYLTGFDTYPATVGQLDGSYPAAVDAPITIEATYNMLGSTYSWASIMVVVGADSNYEAPTGLAVTWHHQAYGGRLQVEELIAGAWGGGWYVNNGMQPAGYDQDLDYKLTVVDYGTSLDLLLAEVGNPANNISATAIDISGYTRAGDNLLVGNFYNTLAGIDEILVTGAGLPVGDIGPASLSISEPSGSDTYVITLAEAIPVDADFAVYLHPSTLESDGLTQATVSHNGTSTGSSDPNTALDILFDSTNWDTPVTVTVTAFDDAIGEEPVDLTLSHSLVLVSGGPVDPETDPNWANAGFANDTVAVAVGDDDQRYAITINEIDPCGIEVSEQGATSDIYTVVLDKQPTITVTVDIDTDGQTTTNPTSLTFVSGDWNVPKTVTVTAVDDAVGEDDPHPGVITNSVPFVPSSVLTEDFEDEVGLQVTLDPNHYVAGGYLRGAMRYPITSSLVDGTHAVSKIEVTFNMLGSTYSWAGPVVLVGRDARTDVLFDGLGITWHQQAYGGRLQIDEFDESAHGASYYVGNDLSPADYDPSADYVMTVFDNGASLDVTIAEAGDPCNNFSVTGIDISGYTRAGDNIGIGQFYRGGGTSGGVEEITITDGPAPGSEELAWYQAPVEFVAPGDGNAWVADNDCREDRATLKGDVDGDCDFDLADFAELAVNWMDCTLPNVPGCI